MKNKIQILGTEYTIEYRTHEQDLKLKKNDGYTRNSIKLIVIEDDFIDRGFITEEDIRKYQNKVLRHEIIHAFMYESGLDCNSRGVESWADNEEMVDWFAIQAPKILKIFKDLKLLEEE